MNKIYVLFLIDETDNRHHEKKFLGVFSSMESANRELDSLLDKLENFDLEWKQVQETEKDLYTRSNLLDDIFTRAKNDCIDFLSASRLKKDYLVKELKLGEIKF